MKLFFQATALMFILFFGVNAYSQSNESATIIGKWISEDDQRRQLVFTQLSMMTYYDKKIVSTNSYEINEDTLKATDKVLNKTFLYSIETLTDLHLSLLFLENGHVTLFRREN
jgi:hypothetical protein